MFGGGTNRTVTIAPESNRLGSAVVTLTAGDGTRNVHESFVVTVVGTSRETWRFDRFGTTANSGDAADGADPDSDAWLNGQEYVLGTDPKAFGEGLRLESAVAMGAGLRLTFQARQASGPGYEGLVRRYDLESSSTVLPGAPWLGVPGFTGLVDSNGTVTILVPAEGLLRFYRLRARLE